MKHQYLLPALIALVTANADVDPACSKALMSCLGTGMLKAGCGIDDLKCACINQKAIKEFMAPCLEHACTVDDINHYLNTGPDNCDGIDGPHTFHDESATELAEFIEEHTLYRTFLT